MLGHLLICIRELSLKHKILCWTTFHLYLDPVILNLIKNTN